MNNILNVVGIQRPPDRSAEATTIESRVARALLVLGLFISVVGCSSQVSFQSADRYKPVTVSGTLYRPEGAGPFPAMVLLHSCSGLRPHVFNWAQWLKAEGYVALAVDSLAPRGTSNVCTEGRNPSTIEMAWDAFGALAYLRSLLFVDRDRVGVMGWSYGAMAALLATRTSYSWARPPRSSFRVAVPFYPLCEYVSSDIDVPVLLLLGEADDWTPPLFCVNTAKPLQQAGRPVLWTVYPGATHGFDQADFGNRTITYLGHTMRYDPAATGDAEKRIRAFLAQYLRRSQP